MQRNMLKSIILIIITFLLTGCYGKYEIHFTKDNTIQDTIYVYEETKVVDSISDKDEEEIFDELLEFERGHDFYKRETYTTEKYSGYKYTYNFNYEEYDAMSQIRKCYEKIELKTENELSLTTSKEFLCGNYYPNASAMEIIITSDYSIKSSNADQINGNQHIWTINKSNYKNKPISITFDTSKIIEEENEETNIIKIIVVFAIFIALIIFVLKN